MVIAPMTWLRAVLGLRMRPAAHTASMRRTRVSPVAASTPTSTKWPAKVCLLVSLLEPFELDREIADKRPVARCVAERDAAVYPIVPGHR